MIEIFSYNETNIRAVKGITDCLYSREYLSTLMSDLFSHTDKLLVVASRNNFDVSSLIRRVRIAELSFGFDQVEYSVDHFDLCFAISRRRDIGEMLVLLGDIWFAFEQPVFCFYKEDMERKEIDFSSIKRASWEQITKIYKGYVFFRSAEEGVLWIGKSDKCEFDLPSPRRL